MKPNVFMSYSRREAPFVDSLVNDLEKNDFKVWLDYRSLIPGTPWAGQIDKGVAEADVIVLVVSKASIKSEYVGSEWKQVIGMKDKRIILAIFETVDLPPELQDKEWVEFRGSYKRGLKELMRQVQAEEAEEFPAPEKGFKAPRRVWAAIFWSIVLGVLSLWSLWTVLFPLVFIQLPYRVYKRNYNFIQVRAMLVLFPIVAWYSEAMFLASRSTQVSPDGWWRLRLIVISILILYWLIHTKDLQRWGKPVASRPKFGNLYRPKIKEPIPTRFYVDYAPEDRKIAKEFIQTMAKYGHPLAETAEEAEIVLVIISSYKHSTVVDPETTPVIPVILQMNNEIAPNLQRVQWIDFRRGVRHLKAMGQLLHDPVDLLRALGVAPSGNQSVMPTIIQILVYFLGFIAVISFGSWMSFFISVSPIIVANGMSMLVGYLLALNIVFFGILIMVVRSLIFRKGWADSVIKLVVWLGVFFGMIALKLNYVFEIMEYYQFGYEVDLEDITGVVAAIPFWTYIYGLGIVALFALRYWKDLWRWFPAKVKNV